MRPRVRPADTGVNACGPDSGMVTGGLRSPTCVYVVSTRTFTRPGSSDTGSASRAGTEEPTEPQGPAAPQGESSKPKRCRGRGHGRDSRGPSPAPSRLRNNPRHGGSAARTRSWAPPLSTSLTDGKRTDRTHGPASCAQVSGIIDVDPRVRRSSSAPLLARGRAQSPGRDAVRTAAPRGRDRGEVPSLGLPLGNQPFQRDRETNTWQVPPGHISPNTPAGVLKLPSSWKTRTIGDRVQVQGDTATGALRDPGWCPGAEDGRAVERPRRSEYGDVTERQRVTRGSLV